MTNLVRAALAAAATASAIGQTGPQAAEPAEHVKFDIAHHHAVIHAHEAAARCLESGRDEGNCQSALQASCNGLAIGQGCGARHAH